ncbi:MAG: YidH family protein [Thermodesulfobacteriota bacterium]
MTLDNRPSQLGEKDVFVRDHLARYRTDLANERTFLSYFRTALACFISGLAFIKFFGHPLVAGVGWILLPTGIMTMVLGIRSYRRTNRAMRKEKAQAENRDAG